VDEVNLLPDALVDALLDVAASGVNTVERDGISQQHAARFVLVRTMNPEEGELRPQLLDRFGLSVALDNPLDPQQRQAILRIRLAFDENPQALLKAHAAELQRLSATVAAARALLPNLDWPDEVLARAAQLAMEAGVDGMRADLVMLRAARALAALEGRDGVTAQDVDAVAEFALAHRRGEALGAPPSGQRSELAPAASRLPPPGRSQAQAQPQPEGDWGALPAEPTPTVQVASLGGWPPKKA
jgi:magnesium chelatase subunit I